ncbi:MAG TPA: glucans biosynthesis glucosyltransferase MdoH [Burkholderiaceae bacterium]|nr:glucans biosynthesis glucosyltransferase MdoH [Burkholderiaceae bacterium]
MELHRSANALDAIAGAYADRAPATLAPAVPPMMRTPMAPQRWGRVGPFSWMLRRLFGFDPRLPDIEGPARGAGRRRRLVLLTLSLLPALYATYVLDGLLPNVVTANETVDIAIAWGETALLIVFALLTCWLAAGFWTAMMGFFVLAVGGDRHLISRSADKASVISPDVRTAIVMPICNEDVRRVFAGLRATYESVMRADALDHFDFFVLSDTGNPDACVAELDAWNALREEIGAESRLFYRHRRRRVKRKSGNLDDFCRRWGAKYRYMVVLDADSVMTGECLTTLVRLMEARPDAGIIQTAPRAVGRDTLHARMQQFANQVYGPVFTAGLHYWQLGESHYWGHNAIIRLEPFMKHCVLAPLPGRGSLAGEILSHDFVEAALMRRAGYGVWIAYDLDGSFEETPPNLLDEVKRDRRWCHGNLMNARLMFARGMHPVHRWVFLTGALAYLSAPLWLGFLALSTWLLLAHANVEPQYFSVPHQLFPHWPSWRPEHAWTLFAAIAAVLFVPKIMAALLAAVRGASSYGGILRLTFSVIVEMLMSALLAPIRMLFHTQFVFAALLGWSIQWKSPSRADKSTSVTQALRRHGLQTAIGLAWVGVVAWKAPDVLPWIAPVAAGLLFAIPISVLTSYSAPGLLARRIKLFMTPDETRPPREVVATAQYARSARALPRFADAVIDPEVHAAVRTAAHRSRCALAAARRAQRVGRAVHAGLDALSSAERVALLHDGAALDELQRAAKIAPVHPSWYASSSSARRATVKVFGRPHEASSKTVATLVRVR